MDTPDNASSVELVILAISEDERLQEWFHSLGKLPHNLRENAILQMTASMAGAGEDPELIRAIARIQRPEFYRAIVRTLEDLLNEE
jgi:hypothetical protein